MEKTSKDIIREAQEDLSRDELEDLFIKFDEYIHNEGWSEWMNEYTDAKEDEEVNEHDLEIIENQQAYNFLNKFNNGLVN